jgi:hypothetical protein
MYQYDLNIENFKVDNRLIDNLVLDDPDRYKFSGVGINIDESSPESIASIISQANSSPNYIGETIKQHESDSSIKLVEYPLPIILNGANLIEIRDALNALVDDTSATISTYDRGLYEAYNKEYGNIDLSQIRNQKHMYVTFMVTDTYTNKKDIVVIDLLQGESSKRSIRNYIDKKKRIFSHRGKRCEYLTVGNGYKFFNNYEEDQYTEQTKFTTKMISQCDYDEFPVYLKELHIENASNLNGTIDGLYLRDAKCYDGTTYITIDATILPED